MCGIYNNYNSSAAVMFGMAIYAFEGIGVVRTVSSSLSRKLRFSARAENVTWIIEFYVCLTKPPPLHPLQVIPAETAMRKPQQFTPVLLGTMFGSSINYICFGLICYLVCIINE